MSKKKINMVKKFIAIVLTVLMLSVNTPLTYAFDMPSVPEAPTVPEGPTVPESPSSPESPTALEAPEAPIVPEAPTAPDAPDAPTAPDAPDAPVTPSSPESPETETLQAEKNGNPTEGNTSASENTQELSTEKSGEVSDGGMGDAEISTGDATSTALVTTNANTNLSAEASNGGSVEVVNSGNGPDSQNSASVAIVDDSSTNQTNSAVVVNDVGQSATTGDNSASENMGSATVETGDANTTATVITAVNTNVDGVMVSEFNVIDDHVGDIILDFGSSCVSGCGTGDIVLENSGNGADSENSIDVLLSDTDATFQSNDATVENNLVLDSDSGGNDANKNMAGAEIGTGDANVSASVLTFANNNIAGDIIYAIVNIFGNLIGDIIFPDSVFLSNDVRGTDIANSGNAAGSENEIVLSEIDASAIVQFNTADIENNVIASATTGDNTADKNMGGDTSISTGDAFVTVQILNIANLNLVAGDYWLVIVNEAGKWIGKILGAPEDSNMAVSSLLEFEIGDNGDISLANKDNGPDSTNTIVLDSESSNEINQVNNAKIVNNLDLSANTGGNTANKNMNGNVSIETGDANIIANIVNFVNNNIVGGGRLFVNIVNVFGSWLGDFVSPGYTKEIDGLALVNEENETAVGGELNHLGDSSSNSESSGNDGGSNEGFDSSSSDGSIIVHTPLVRAAGTSFGFGSFSANQGEEDGEIALVSGNSGSAEVAGKKVVNVNLAWIFVLITPFVFAKVKKRLVKVLAK